MSIVNPTVGPGTDSTTHKIHYVRVHKRSHKDADERRDGIKERGGRKREGGGFKRGWLCHDDEGFRIGFRSPDLTTGTFGIAYVGKGWDN